MSTIHPLQSIGIVHCPFFTSHGDSVFQVLYMFKSPTVKTEEPLKMGQIRIFATGVLHIFSFVSVCRYSKTRRIEYPLFVSECGSI